jgi:hypothetical protein
MKTLVVAQYKENVEWAFNPVGVEPHIVQKDVDVPNVGREPFSFLWYIISNYHKLEGEYYFVQGNPFDHCPDLLKELELPTTSFRWLGKGQERYVSDGNGNPHHSGLPVEDVCCRLTNRCGVNHYNFTPGGQFAVTADIIKKKPLHYYLLAMTIMAENDFKTSPWVFERIWEEVFQ